MLESLSTYLSVDKGALIAPLCILASALIGSSVALWAVLSNRSMARLKNSMDFANSYNEDKDISKAVNEVQALKATASSDIQKMAVSGASAEQTIHIRAVLNYYEAMAICINHKIYNENIIKETVYTTVIDIWDICEPYVLERRKQKNNKTFFQEVQKLVGKWKDNPLKSKNGN